MEYVWLRSVMCVMFAAYVLVRFHVYVLYVMRL